MKKFRSSKPVPGCRERDAQALESGCRRLFAPGENDSSAIDGIVQADRKAHQEHGGFPEERRRRMDESIASTEASRNAIRTTNADGRLWSKAGEHLDRAYDSRWLNLRWTLFTLAILGAIIPLFRMTWVECFVAVAVAVVVCIGGRALWSVLAAAFFAGAASLQFVWDGSRLGTGYLALRWKLWRRNVWSMRERKLNRIIDHREQILRCLYRSSEAVALSVSEPRNTKENTDA